MKFKLLLVVLFLNCIICFSQSQLAQRGIITLADNQKIAFNNIRLESGKFAFFDIKSNAESSLSISEIKYIEDANQSRIFTNKSLVDRTREADLKQEVEQKRLAIEQAAKKEIARRKALEDEKTALAFDLYPNGIYATKEDFLNKKPTNQEELVAKEVADLDKETYEGCPDECFFYYLKADRKVKSSFAVSYRGRLYFQIDAILNNRNKTDRSQSNDHPNSFVKVKIHGENYYYIEADLANFWDEGFTYGAGGIVGAALASSNITIKGIVWDIKNEEFNIFKSCIDYNKFIKDKYPEGLQECKENQRADVLEIRKAIQKIK